MTLPALAQKVTAGAFPVKELVHHFSNGWCKAGATPLVGHAPLFQSPAIKDELGKIDGSLDALDRACTGITQTSSACRTPTVSDRKWHSLRSTQGLGKLGGTRHTGACACQKGGRSEERPEA